MRLNDTLAGLMILVFGVAVAAYARTFPAIPGQQIGPSLFPATIGIACVLLGAALIVSGRQRRGEPLVLVDEWARRQTPVRRFSLVIAMLLFYALAVDGLGFLLTAVAFLSVLMLAFGVQRRWVAPVAAAVTIAIHYGFYTVLRVPLPWGLLESLAW